MSNLKATAAKYDRARTALTKAEAERLKAIRDAKAEGMSLRAIGSDVGLSFGRIRQLLDQ